MSEPNKEQFFSKIESKRFYELSLKKENPKQKQMNGIN